MKKLLFILFLLPISVIAQSAEPQTREELREIKKFYFGRGSFITSEEEREELKELVFAMRADSTLRVHIAGYTDRWGDEATNERFAYVRAMYLADWMRSCRVPREQITFVSEGVDTQAANDAEARRVEISEVVTVIIPPAPAPAPAPAPQPTPKPQPKPEVKEVAETPAPAPAPVPVPAPAEPEPTEQPAAEQEPIGDRSNFTLRTNLLYFAGGLFNIGIEFRSQNSDWGYLLNGGYSPFGGDGWEHSMGGWFISPEVRYYIPKQPQWFVGAQLLAGGYNIKLSDLGYQGIVVGGGVMGGYKITLTERFDMDFNIGVGYGSYSYDSYYHADGVNLYSGKDLKKGTILPQAGVNLIWKIK